MNLQMKDNKIEQLMTTGFDEFSKLHVNDWADEFGQQVGERAFGEDSSDNWDQAYDEFLIEQVVAKQRSDISRDMCVFRFNSLCWSFKCTKRRPRSQERAFK